MIKKNQTLILILFMLGIFMGAIDTGIVSPVRGLIQNSFKVDQNIGTWMITLYTLIYAISMPIVSKLGDKYGYKKAYVFGIATFGIGSLLCGISNFYGTFGFFLTARAIQALGAGGIMPIANAVIGNSFPEEKRGSALGLVGMIYGVGNILGPTLGSSIIDMAGSSNWGWVFFINVPISLIILILSTSLKNTKASTERPMDILGAIVLGGVIGSLMYALTNLDFFNFTESIKSTDVYPYLIIFVLLTPLLISIENRAKDPVLNVKYFKNKEMLVILIISFIVGIGMMGMIFVPQFSENVLRLKSGSGGYLITLLALFSGISAPISGKLIDKKSARFVLLLGFTFTICGTLFLGLIATESLTFISIFIGLALMGLGVGFTMGAPLNYLVLKTVSKEESASGLATMSLMRSIGLAISPSVMIGFIVEASKTLQTKLMDAVQSSLGATTSGMPINPTNTNTDVFKSLQNADITTIVDMLKAALESILPSQIKPMIINAIDSVSNTIIDTFQSVINYGYRNMFIAAAIIALAGLIATLFLNRKCEKPKVS
ncbi:MULTISPECIES: MFS transporter [Clostridium]|uniref:MFS transporter n=1 Tax=Clostridium cibarium TaxID=2762247 RepID=A0ABR8PUK2_9CLOT|nr:MULTISPECIES: MFS transporter [Clostridium]MBD7911850.1 MFS transporter [Clostridium cibarium]